MLAERAMIFPCAGEQLVGVLAVPPGVSKLGVLVVVGGPQYRVGSHRQFALLARRLAREGVPVMRFDCRGMGDSSGSPQTFEHTTPDIRAAIDAFLGACPSLSGVVLWGLCDAASAALLYWGATADSRIAGMVLLNPWVRSDSSLARTHIKHYYGQRLFERDFWTKLLRGKLNVLGALRSFGRSVAVARGDAPAAIGRSVGSFQDRMANAMASFVGPILLILSGRDLTAHEFLVCANSKSEWKGVIEAENVDCRDLPEADHTFSTSNWREEVEALTLNWVERLIGADVR
jgi:exosortase A-associated hydrolase 1